MKKFDNFKNAIANNLFIFRYALKTAPLYTLFTCFNTSIHVVIMFFEFQYMAKYMIDCLQYSRPIIYAAGYLAFVFLIITVWLVETNIINAHYKKKGQIKLYKRLHLDIYQKTSEIDLACYDDPDFYNDFVWAMSEATKRTDAVLESISLLSRSIAIFLSSGLFMLLNEIVGLIVVVVTFSLTFLVNVKINKHRFDLDEEIRPIQRRRDYINRVFYLNEFSKEVRLHDIKGKLYKDFKKSNDQILDKINKKTRKISILTFISDYIFSSFILDSLYVLFLMFKAMVLKVLSYGTVIGLLRSSWRVRDGINMFTQALPQFQQHSLYIDKLKKFLSYEAKIKNKEHALKVPEDLSVLELKNVSFSYDSGKEFVLKDINMTINPKEKIAIVGYNGAGKTTLTKLLMRLYDVSEGEILYNGLNIKEYDLTQYRDNFGAVFQDYQLFAASIAENITMGNEKIDETKVENALEQSGFVERLRTMKNGIHSQLTREFDDAGENLSGGEAQKVAIARVLYKDCNIIILDEPSSALDPISEFHLNETIMNAAKQKTVILISHRLSTTRMADRIYMFENGRIIETGSHEELMKLGGKYAYMFNLQAEKYKVEEFMSQEIIAH